MKKGSIVYKKIMMDILHYPDMHPTVQSVVNHILCVNGNGIKWINGKPSNESKRFSKYSSPSLTIQAIIHQLHDAAESFDRIYVGNDVHPDKMSEWQYEHLERLIKEYITIPLNTILNIQSIMQQPMVSKFSWYPLCQYAVIANIPDNVHPDWLELCIKTLQLIIARPEPDADNDGEDAYEVYLHGEHGWIKNREYAQKILSELESRFQLKA